MHILRKLTLGLVVMLGLVTAPLVVATSPVHASTAQKELCEGTGGTWDGDNCNNTANATGGTLPEVIRTIVNIFLFIAGAVAVLMIVIGGIRYVVSGGDQSAVTGAKNTILYAVIGLVVSLLAYALVDFVVDSIAKP